MLAHMAIQKALHDLFNKKGHFRSVNPSNLPAILVLTERLWQYHPKWKQPKWKYSTFCTLAGTTSYPYLPLRRIDQRLLNRWTSQLDLGCTTGCLERVVSVHNST
jgi:hypothetical protein